MDLDLLVKRKEGWWGLPEGMKDLVGIMELLVRDILVFFACSDLENKEGFDLKDVLRDP